MCILISSTCVPEANVCNEYFVPTWIMLPQILLAFSCANKYHIYYTESFVIVNKIIQVWFSTYLITAKYATPNPFLLYKMFKPITAKSFTTSLHTITVKSAITNSECIDQLFILVYFQFYGLFSCPYQQLPVKRTIRM